MPESCAVALRIDGAAGSWVGVWRPAGRRLHQFAAPLGWAPGAGYWSRDGVLHLPYANAATPCGVALLEAPEDVDPSPCPAVRMTVRAERNRPPLSALLLCVSRFRWGRRLCTEPLNLTKLATPGYAAVTGGYRR